ncbi:MAG: hypothetical protein HND48_25230 [Chloroflexi bacterium]|nr:hypothetical protein [Chloroflexota bacterium]
MQAELSALHEAEARREDMQREETLIREEIADRKARLDTLELDGGKLRKRRDTLAETDDANCPTCGQPLTPEHRAEMVGQLDGELVAHRAEWVEAKARAAELDDRLKRHGRELKKLTATLAGMAKLQERAGHLSASAEAVAQAASRQAEDAQQLTP